MITFYLNGDNYNVEFEGEEGFPATIDSPEVLDEFYLTEIYINNSDTDFIDNLSEDFIDQLTGLALEQIKFEAKENEMEKQLELLEAA